MAPLPASLLGSVYNIKARRAQTGGHAKAHPSSLPLFSALRDGPCTRATSKTPAETPRLRANHTAAQSLRADNRRDRAEASTSCVRHCHLAWVSLTIATARIGDGRAECWSSLFVCLWSSSSRTRIHHTGGPFEGMTCHSQHMYNGAVRPLHVHPVPFTTVRRRHYKSSIFSTSCKSEQLFILTVNKKSEHVLQILSFT